MTTESKKGKGRPAISDERKKATVLLIHYINDKSGLSPGQLEAVFGITSTPPGNNWCRWGRGERTLGPEVRARIAKIAVEKGWLNKAGIITRNEWLACAGYSSATLDQIQQRLKAQKKQLRKYKKLTANSLLALQELERLLEEELNLDDWEVAHEDYAETVTYHEDGLEIKENRIRRYHQSDFLLELKKLKEKISGISFPVIEVDIEDDEFP